MRKKTAMVLAGALVLAVMLNGCGGQGAGTAGGEKASEEEVSGEEANRRAGGGFRFRRQP